MGWMLPTSLLAACTDTSTVSASSAASNARSSMKP